MDVREVKVYCIRRLSVSHAEKANLHTPGIIALSHLYCVATPSAARSRT